MPNYKVTHGSMADAVFGLPIEEYFNQLKDARSRLSRLVMKMETEANKTIAEKQRQSRIDAEREIAEMRANWGGMSEKQIADVRKKLLADADRKLLQDRAKKQTEALKSLYGVQTKYDKKRRAKEISDRKKENEEVLASYEALRGRLTPEQKKDMAIRQAELKEARKGEGRSKLVSELRDAMKQLTSAIDSGMSTYAKYQEGVNARLQGSSIETGIYGSNYFAKLEGTLSTAVGVTPYFSTEKMLGNLHSLVEAGIASNVEQRAFLQTAKDEIATTFDAANSALLRIIRLQQSDSTAARLGMEAYLTRFLNELTDNTEYLNSTFDSVQEALLEASSLMSSETASSMEYVVQKWLGALTGVGLSESSATGIAQALGYLGSGNVDALNGSAFQNLLVMAASRSGLSYSDMLTGGLSASTADSLMKSLVEYMAEIGSSDNNVVKSQFAQTFGLSVSDLVAAGNLSSSIGDIYGNLMGTSGMYDELAYQLNQIPGRLTLSGMLDTLSDNLLFSMSTDIAKNPALAALWKVTGLLGDTGGISIPAILAAGFGVDMNANVEDIMRGTVMGIGALGTIGDIISGLSSTFVPSSVLKKLGITQSATAIRRGTGIETRSGGLETSQSTYVGSGSGDEIYESAITSAEDSTSASQAEAAAEHPDYSEKIFNALGGAEDNKIDVIVSVLRSIGSDTAEMRTALSTDSLTVNLSNDTLMRIGTGV